MREELARVCALAWPAAGPCTRATDIRCCSSRNPWHWKQKAWT